MITTTKKVLADLSDYVKVVRCKDCRHRIVDKDFSSGHYCKKRPANGGRFCDDDDYCTSIRTAFT